MDERFCFLDNTDWPIVINVSCDRHLALGADFKLFDNDDKSVIEEWNFSMEGGNSYSHRLSTKPSKVSKLGLAWQIVCCSKKSNVFDGHIDISSRQGEKILRTTKSTKYSITNLSPCGMGGKESFKGSMVFINSLDKQKE